MSIDKQSRVRDIDQRLALIEKWAKLHVVRTVLGFAANLAFLMASAATFSVSCGVTVPF
jgi:hypothetical protein